MMMDRGKEEWRIRENKRIERMRKREERRIALRKYREMKKELETLKGYKKRKKLEEVRRFDEKLKKMGVGYVKRMGMRWVSNLEIVELVGGRREGMFYRRLTAGRNLVKRWNALKRYIKRRGKTFVARKRYVKSYYLMFKTVKNNVMGTLVDSRGRVIVKRTGGEVGFKGSKRNSSVAASVIGTVMGNIARQRKILNVIIRLKGRLGYKWKLFLKGFLKGSMKICGVEYRYIHTHKSFKMKKMRRV